jgi:23S rRNA pseudouridine1911/1915/1917 synthase
VSIELGSHLPIIYESEQIIVVNKPAGFHSAPLKHTASGDGTPNVLSALAAIRPAVATSTGPHPWEGTLLHRLDQGTSGALAFAANSKYFPQLKSLWSKHSITKSYIAWTLGHLITSRHQPLVLTPNLAHDPKSKRRMIVVEHLPAAARRQIKQSWPTRTTIKTLALSHSPQATLLQIDIETGVMHQIRATLAALGHAVLGDTVYKSATRFSPFREQHLDLCNNEPSAVANLPTGQPRLDLLPQHGFFLHSQCLQTEDFTAHAPTPIWFGNHRI